LLIASYDLVLQRGPGVVSAKGRRRRYPLAAWLPISGGGPGAREADPSRPCFHCGSRSSQVLFRRAIRAAARLIGPVLPGKKDHGISDTDTRAQKGWLACCLASCTVCARRFARGKQLIAAEGTTFHRRHPSVVIHVTSDGHGCPPRSRSAVLTSILGYGGYWCSHSGWCHRGWSERAA
jgi:hypothetical protein